MYLKTKLVQINIKRRVNENKVTEISFKKCLIMIRGIRLLNIFKKSIKINKGDYHNTIMDIMGKA